MAVKDFLVACRDTLPDPEFWENLEDIILKRGSAEKVLTDKNGNLMQCQVRGLSGNSSMVSFMPATADTTAQDIPQEATG